MLVLIDMVHKLVQLDVYSTIFANFTNTLITLPLNNEKFGKVKVGKGQHWLGPNQPRLATDRGSHFLLGRNIYDFPLQRTRVYAHY